jgi:hypothetical protein
LKIFKGGTAKKYNIIIFDQLILIYRANIGKRAILCQNIGIIGHIQKDRDLIGNIGPLEGLIICNNYLKTSKKKNHNKMSQQHNFSFKQHNQNNKNRKTKQLQSDL